MGWIEIVGLQQYIGAKTTKPFKESEGTDRGIGLVLGDLEIT